MQFSFSKILILFSLLISFLSCKKHDNSNFQHINGNVFGSTFDLQYYSEEDLSQSVESLFVAVNNSLSTYQKNSEISRWNAGDGNMKVSALFLNITEKAKKVYLVSMGYYDPTVKPLVEGWGFGNGQPNSSLSPHQVDSLMDYVGFDKISIDVENQQIHKSNPHVQLDFNSIAPGYTADLVAEIFLHKNITNFLVDIGGEIRCSGKNLVQDKYWKVGIEDPTKKVNERSYLEVVTLKNTSLATSGNYRKIKTDSAGNKIVHTINPKTGYPVVSNLLSSSIVTEECCFADAYATATMAMGYDLAVSFAEKNDLESYLITDKNNTITLKKIK